MPLRLGRVSELSEADLDELVAQATVDCYNEYEELAGLAVMLEDNLAVPFETTVLGVPVTVRKIDQTESGIVAICVRGKHRQAIPVLDLPLPEPPPGGAEWIAAYRRWAGWVAARVSVHDLLAIGGRREARAARGQRPVHSVIV